MFVHSTTLTLNQPFEWVMEKSGVKTRSSEQTMLPVEADLLLGPDSSLEIDLETDDQYYSPTEVYSLTCTVILLISCTCLALHSLDMICVHATCLVSNYHICELCNAFFLQDIIYVNYAMLSCCKALYM